ncbi:HAD-IIB family hydrolase [Falsihalocynthiibacter arcticus]|uniref:Mannosyl-3-phosphoglycerate phosphatase n=1 Tax=Falsihalocynthiibacter arcticus TaxID=1579316 RepID=A0A126V3T2_9RHOB|nr:HAD-IIB family hydrolase [Falsihalocynthiibacter arcticus]AML52974.1 mannosyl-3-phosphoglycerate phosphatase [Falsihalocynthiibacter arcticus]
MNSEIELMVFTDLDGSLIDHNTYEWAPARQALTSLDNISAGVVLSSSKTAAEIGRLRAELGLEKWPAIVENGAGILPPFVADVATQSAYQDLLVTLAQVPPGLRRHFRGFADITTTELADITGLSPAAAARAQNRCFSEPGQWLGTDAQQAEFVTLLTSWGIQVQQGGRFLTLSFGGNKADQMRSIIKAYHPKHTIALGDAPNDVQMLEAAEFGVVVANPHRLPLPPLKGEPEGHVLRTQAAGPEGWNAAVLYLLNRLELQ